MHPDGKNVTLIYDIYSDVWTSGNIYNCPIWQNDDIGVASLKAVKKNKTN